VLRVECAPFVGGEKDVTGFDHDGMTLGCGLWRLILACEWKSTTRVVRVERREKSESDVFGFVRYESVSKRQYRYICIYEHLRTRFLL
jgi:hypothetical protein